MDNDIHNWYELLVYDKLRQMSRGDLDLNDEQLSDVACVTLNHLPPRYVRHSVDMSFYTSPMEKKEMEDRIEQAISNAVNFVKQHPVEKQL